MVYAAWCNRFWFAGGASLALVLSGCRQDGRIQVQQPILVRTVAATNQNVAPQSGFASSEDAQLGDVAEDRMVLVVPGDDLPKPGIGRGRESAPRRRLMRATDSIRHLRFIGSNPVFPVVGDIPHAAGGLAQSCWLLMCKTLIFRRQAAVEPGLNIHFCPVNVATMSLETFF